ncbi:CCE_0567 family metalloprotein [Skermanella pratensis]|uniref:CCE_0567 family metalloprotein n=1 Tax=Skermanella pratensis TaxID=2233999 RepID=UPI0013018125|nr:CCE_0567 family metalloprotein [Skermanella pratensis]
MSDIDALKDEIKKLNARATAKKMDLHDLSEELPGGWEKILEVAQETYDAFKLLTEKRAELKALTS